MPIKPKPLMFQAISRPSAEVMNPIYPHVVISMRDKGTQPVLLRTSYTFVDKLYLQVDDVDGQVETKDCSRCGGTGKVGLEACYKCKASKKCKEFSKEDANAILDFVEKYKKKVRLVVCQCEMGISRSSGVAGALAKIYNNDDSKFFKSPYVPNMLIYRIMLKVAEERGMING